MLMKELDIINERLKQLAFTKTQPFCYGCYAEAPKGTCKTCGSDDLMRLLPGVGCEYGTDWVVTNLIEENLTPVNSEEAFEESIRQCYPETVHVGWLELDTVTTIKEMDPISWDLAQSEWLSNEEAEGLIVTFDNGNSHYYLSDIESYLNGAESESQVGA